MNIDFDNLPKKSPEFDLTELLEAGCHFGHQSRRWHPKMAEWIYTQKDGVHIFDLAKTATQLQKAYNYAYQLGTEGKTLIFVATKKQARDIVKEAATDAGAFYITSRWLGGLLTNWSQVEKSLKRMLTIEKGLQTGKYDGYTKFERVQLEKSAGRLERFFGGLRDLKSEPDALFIVDPGKEDVVVKEAKIMDVPVMAMIDSNTDPRPIDLVIPANDDAVKSIQYLVNAVAAGYKAGKADKGRKPVASKTVATTPEAPKAEAKKVEVKTETKTAPKVEKVEEKVEAKPKTETKKVEAKAKTEAKPKAKATAKPKAKAKTEASSK